MKKIVLRRFLMKRCFFGRGAALFIAVVAVFALSCTKPEEKQAADTVVYSYPSNVGPLNPHLYAPNAMFAQDLVYESLVRLKDDGTIGPALAESWDISPDGMVYTFHLRQDVQFSDGEPFNAAAAALNFNAIMGNAARHAWLGITNKIEQYEASGPYDFTLTFNTPYYPCLHDLALPRPFTFLSPKSFPDDGDTSKSIKSPVGTGPWKLAESRLGEYDLFERNDSYWGGKPNPAKILVKVIPDPVTRALAFESGDINFIYGMGQINYDTFNRLRNSEGVIGAISGPRGTTTLALNTATGPTRELAVRQAIQHLINKAEIIKGITLDTQIAADTYFAADIPYCDVALEPYTYDEKKAAELLDGAGWLLPAGKKIREKNGVPLEMDFCFTGNNAAEKSIVEVLQGQALKLGVSFNLIGEEADSFNNRQKTGNFGIIFNNTWGPPYEPHAMVSAMLVPSNADYMAQIGLPMKAQLDANIRRVFGTTDVNERSAIYRDILTTLHEQAVYVPLYYTTMLKVYRKAEIRDVGFSSNRDCVPLSTIILE
ncbi:MAG: nickel ABC transporter substrate-binding protein [Spirochaetaceae bacterium]|jgi:nickel transport system substrate-binding protein|nr:nickel ABC transporter substrate-binding protein [Spirochaetaceae bacterium]